MDCYISLLINIRVSVFCWVYIYIFIHICQKSINNMSILGIDRATLLRGYRPMSILDIINAILFRGLVYFKTVTCGIHILTLIIPSLISNSEIPL